MVIIIIIIIIIIMIVRGLFEAERAPLLLPRVFLSFFFFSREGECIYLSGRKQ